MPNPGDWSLSTSVAAFLVATLVIGIVGTRLAITADTLAARTGLGEALFGALFLGGSTSLAGLATSMTAAYNSFPEIAVSNAAGGIAGQTVFLAVADTVYRKANLEHAAASSSTLIQGALLIAILSIPMIAATGPDLSVAAVHPATPLMIIFYVFGWRMVSQVQATPMWSVHRTHETVFDEPGEEDEDQPGLVGLWARFGIYAVLIATAGWLVGRTGVSIALETGLSQTVVGGLMTALATSIPELVTSIAAVRRGALTLAVSNVIGGNAFDTLFVSFSDIVYRGGSLYHAITDRQLFLFMVTILMTAILMMGFVRRETYGIANIGFESVLIAALYVGMFGLLILG